MQRIQFCVDRTIEFFQQYSLPKFYLTRLEKGTLGRVRVRRPGCVDGWQPT